MADVAKVYDERNEHRVYVDQRERNRIALVDRSDSLVWIEAHRGTVFAGSGGFSVKAVAKNGITYTVRISNLLAYWLTAARGYTLRIAVHGRIETDPVTGCSMANEEEE